MTPAIPSKTSLSLFERAMAGPVPAALRVLAGALYWPTSTHWRTGGHLREFGLFLAFLASLRIGAMIFRRAPVFHHELQQTWYRQRQLAKHFDSYQWAKLLWVGLGLAAYTAYRGQWDSAEGVVAAAALGAGILGQTFWMRHRTEHREEAATAR